MSWVRWGAIAAPVVLIGVLTAVNRWSGPTQAHAEARDAAAAMDGTGTTQSKEASEVEKWIAEHQGPVTSPFEASPEPVSAPSEPKAFEGVKLTSVFRSNETAIAAINGKLVREGEEVRPGVRVKTIDARARKVILILDDGREIEVTPGRSGRTDASEGSVRRGT